MSEIEPRRGRWPGARGPQVERPDPRVADSRALIENVEQQHFIYTHDVDGVFTYVSASIERMLGYSVDEFCRHFSTYLSDHPDNALVHERTRRSIAGERQPPYLVQLRARDGSLRWLEVVEVPVRDDAGAVVAVQGLARDVTERQRAEEALRESEQRFRELAESLPEAVFEIDAGGALRYVNDAGLRNFGYTREAFARGVDVASLLVTEDRPRALGNIARRLAGEAGSGEYTAQRLDGSRFPVQIQSRPVWRDGRVVAVRGLIIDLSERAQLEAERLRAQKFESIGILAGGIAHDFNNVLAAVLGNLELARLDLDDAHPARASLEQAERAALHGRALTQQLLTFARGGEPVKRVVALGALLRDATRLALTGSRARHELDVADGLWPVEADAGQLAQVFNNVLINAAQAMPEGGAVRVRARNSGPPAEVPPGVQISPSGHWVHVDVEDCGSGIAPEDLPRVFDPYFTTKTRGSGLGLAVAYSVIRGHGGLISLRSAPGVGTCCSVWLPALPRSEVARDPGPARVPRGQGLVLVMDDDAQVRQVVERMLKALGYHTLVARDGAEALALVQDRTAAGERVRAALLDLTVPGALGGAQIVAQLAELDPGIRRVACSGYSDDPVMARHAAFGFDEVLAKPFRLEQLATLLHTLLLEPRPQ